MAVQMLANVRLLAIMKLSMEQSKMQGLILLNLALKVDTRLFRRVAETIDGAESGDKEIEADRSGIVSPEIISDDLWVSRANVKPNVVEHD